MIIRAIHNKENPYFMVVRATAQDENLSARALGVLVYLMSKPDSWEPSISDICRRFSDVGRDQAYKIINEIFIPLRYARRVQERRKGKVSRWITEIYEAPVPEDQEVDSSENQENSEGAGNPENQEEFDDEPVPDHQEVETTSWLPHPENQELDINRIENIEELLQENTEQQQAAAGRRIAAAAATGFQERHLSRFPFPTVEDFVRLTKRHATNPGGLARILWRTGEEDERIAEWMEAADLGAKPRQAQLVGPNDDFSIDDYIERLIANNDLSHLRHELEGINERGGPKLDWERRVFDYFNNQQSAADEAARQEAYVNRS